MKKILAAAAAASFLFVAPALASHCPKDAAAIDAALENVEFSNDVRVAVIELRDQGMAAHEAGDHAQSEALLAEAMRQLLLAL